MKRERPAVITDAQRSQDDQLRSREIRYGVMMTLRVVCLIVAAVLVGTRAPLLGLWLPLCVVGMVALPWFAVIIANDRPPKERQRRRLPQRAEQSPTRALTSAPDEVRVIDVEQ